jgi:SAM-dependent methyltransferase
MSMSAQAEQQLRDQLGHWDAVAEGWGRWLEWTERNFSPLTTWLAGACALRDGMRLLDVCCGAGYPALELARRVAPHGRVMATDLSPAMVRVAAQHAHATGVGNITFGAMGAEHLELEDDAFDTVTNAYGLMFCPEPPAAIAEAHRVLARGGTLALVTWDEPQKSPFMTTIRGAAERALALKTPPADGPGPFRFSSPAALRTLLESAGFSDVRVESLPMTFELASALEYLQLFTDYAWKAKVEALSSEAREEFRRAVEEAARPHAAPDGRLRLVATSLCTVGRK